MLHVDLQSVLHIASTNRASDQSGDTGFTKAHMSTRNDGDTSDVVDADHTVTRRRDHSLFLLLFDVLVLVVIVVVGIDPLINDELSKVEGVDVTGKISRQLLGSVVSGSLLELLDDDLEIRQDDVLHSVDDATTILFLVGDKLAGLLFLLVLVLFLRHKLVESLIGLLLE